MNVVIKDKNNNEMMAITNIKNIEIKDKEIILFSIFPKCTTTLNKKCFDIKYIY